MSNTEEKTNEMDETLEKVIVEEEGHSFLQNESEKETDPNLQNDDQFAADDNEVTLEGLVKERDDLKDKLMRSLAESENIRKRALKDRQDTEIYAVSKMSRDILSVYDNLQRALDLAEDILDEKSLPMIEGLELTKKDLLEIFKRNRIEKIEPITGDKFDPKLHQAMMEAPSNEIEKGHIVGVLTVGFLIGDRLLRASNVTVSSGQREEIGDDKD
ncbi:MAG: nucleotide exchange factor GrpE [Paracoccaceae bacterium]|tara:strand:+ start:30 stop:674 length:645 start_codon:yes stop_codon:yes gene_type:complete